MENNDDNLSRKGDNPSTREVEAGKSLSSSLAWSTEAIKKNPFLRNHYQAGLELTGIHLLLLWGAGIKSVYHYTQFTYSFFFFNVFV